MYPHQYDGHCDERFIISQKWAALALLVNTLFMGPNIGAGNRHALFMKSGIISGKKIRPLLTCPGVAR